MIGLGEVEAARDRIQGLVHRTPLRHSTTFSRMTDADVHVKLENTQRTGSFKIRGALNKILSLTADERARGVAAASAGNHAQGVALAAQLNGVKATIVMPEHASIAKVSATRGYGAEVVLHGETYNDAFAKCQELREASGATLVHAFNDDAIMAGQGTLGLEILEDVPDLDMILCPIGGGGLISGVATAAKAVNPAVQVVGVQPEGADSAARSVAAGKLVTLERLDTIADGLATKHIGERTFEVIQQRVDQIVTVSDREIAHAILLLLERAKNVVEGAGAAALAALLSRRVDVEGKKVAVVVSGGNIDITFLDEIIARGLHQEGRLFRFRVTLKDRPGSLHALLGVLSGVQANIRHIVHERNDDRLAFNQTDVTVDVETRGPEHQQTVKEALSAAGYEARLLGQAG